MRLRTPTSSLSISVRSLIAAASLYVVAALLSACRNVGGPFDPLRGPPAAPARGAVSPALQSEHGITGTFSIVAADPETGVRGAAVAGK